MKGRQLQTIELQGNEKLRVSFIKFSLKNNYDHKGNQFNQVGLMGVSVWGKVKPEPNKAGGLKQRKTEAEMDRVPRRQDLAFLMYTDKDVAEVIFLIFLFFNGKWSSKIGDSSYAFFKPLIKIPRHGEPERPGNLVGKLGELRF